MTALRTALRRSLDTDEQGDRLRYLAKRLSVAGQMLTYSFSDRDVRFAQRYARWIVRALNNALRAGEG